MSRWLVWLALAGFCGCDDGGEAAPEPEVDAAPDALPQDAATRDAAPPPEDSGADATPPPADAAPAEPDAAPFRACENTTGALPDGLTALEHHDGTGVADVTEQNWTVVEQSVGNSVLHEAVRFDLDRPARIHGFAVQFGVLPNGRDTTVAGGIYRDFGHNGFDFWAAEPYWEGKRCRGDLRSAEWVHYALPEALELSDPGPIYVAHRRRGRRDAAWLFDQTPPTPDCGNDCCTAFAACHSAWNFPELTTFTAGGAQNYAWNGLSTSFALDYMVRLYVEYLDEVRPEDHLFTPVPEVQMANRMAWGDFDNDGDDDLLLNGPRLMQNDGGVFTDVSADAGLVDAGLNGSGVFGDYDNDGCLDIFLFDEAFNRGDHLLHSDCAGGFVEVTAEAGITDIQAYNSCLERGENAPTPAAAWIDLDADGFLDLYQANFICWDDGSVYVDTVWHNNGDGTFEPWTGARGFSGVDQPRFASRGALPVDADDDGDMDLFVNNYRLNQNLYYRNDGGGRFTEAALEVGLAGSPSAQGRATYYGHSIGGAFGDLDGDGDLDAVVANLAHPRFWDFSDKTEVLINQGDGTFVDIQGDWSRPAGDAGLRYQETHSVPTLADFDHDGHLDLVISAVYDGRPTDFYWGNGDGTFRLDAWRSGIATDNGWGQAVADLDLDGDLDLATSRGLYRNQRVPAGHWLQVKVVGNVASNRAALGATVRVDIGATQVTRFVGGGTGQGNQDSLYLHFGLGEASRVDRIRIRFPGAAAEQIFEGPFDADQRLWLYEDGAVRPGWRNDP